jgi:hypothetical protein
MNRLRPDLRRPDLIDAGLVLAALLLHAGGAFLIDTMPPNRPFEVLLIGLPALVLLVALAAVLVRGERRPLQAACVLQWLLVLFALPAKLAGLAFVPAALALSAALLWRSRSSAGPDPDSEPVRDPVGSGPSASG